MKEFTYKIDLEDEEERIDKWISNTLQTLSRSYIQKLIKENNVFVNGKAQKASYRIKADDVIRFQIPDASEPSIPGAGCTTIFFGLSTMRTSSSS